MVAAHAAFTDSTEGKIRIREMEKRAVHGDTARGGFLQHAVDDVFAFGEDVQRKGVRTFGDERDRLVER